MKKICLAISEPYAGFLSVCLYLTLLGSDVASIRCTAKKTPDGKFYIVNGVKKWKSNY